MSRSYFEALKLELKMHDTLSGRGIVNYDPGPEEKQEFERMVHGYLRGEVTEQEMFSDKQTIMQTKLMFQIFKEFHENQEKQLMERPVGATYGEGDEFGGGDGGEGAVEEPDEGVGDAEEGDAGFSLGKARDDNRPPGVDDEEEEGAPPSPNRFATDGEAPRLDKQELFMTFKETHAQGREIETRFRSLKAAKQRAGQLVQEVNKRKRVIDEAEFGLKQIVAQKRNSGASDIVDNDEWEAQKVVRDAKKDYRTHFDAHAEQKRVMADIEKQIAQSKVDLVTQFEHWYQTQYGQMSGDGHAGDA